jgi:hypothetical protein
MMPEHLRHDSIGWDFQAGLHNPWEIIGAQCDKMGSLRLCHTLIYASCTGGRSPVALARIQWPPLGPHSHYEELKDIGVMTWRII